MKESANSARGNRAHGNRTHGNSAHGNRAHGNSAVLFTRSSGRYCRSESGRVSQRAADHNPEETAHYTWDKPSSDSPRAPQTWTGSNWGGK